MSFFSSIDYRIYKASGDNFSCMLDSLLQNIDGSFKVLRLVFFCNISDSDDYSRKLQILRMRIGLRMLAEEPVVSLVPQQPLDSDVVLEVHEYLPNEDENIEYKKFCDFPYVILTNAYGRFLYAGGLHSSLDKDVYTQSVEIFCTLYGILNQEGFPVDSIIRQWNYIGNITSFDSDGNQNYQMFNNARSEFYSSSLWSNGYPAATGIGILGNCVVVDVDAVIIKDELFHIKPIDNKLQVAAHSYSDEVLVNTKVGLATPKFERAQSLVSDNFSLIYVSGTAAIRGEKSIYENVTGQLNITLENISQLIANSKIKLLRVYLKNKSDYEEIRNVLSEKTDVYISYLEADICRDELLIEIEGIAVGI